MDSEELICIELVFATEQEQQLLAIEVEKGTTAREALLESQLVRKYPDFDFTQCPLGIWGRLIPDTQPLKKDDRVEAYRPLRRDPREARRELALAGRSMGGASPEG